MCVRCRYLDGLVGPWPAAKALYEQRSPLHALDGFKKPIVFFQVVMGGH